MSYKHKICDPVHGFIRFGEIEKKVIDSRPFQRLRYIHQVGIVYLVYPGATHSRFEHSLGVMELVTRIYKNLIAPHHEVFPLSIAQKELEYWLLILRLAALCHDMGHLPFSHTAEKSLLSGGGHEQMTKRIIQSDELRSIWKEIGENVEHDILKLAVMDSGYSLSDWEQTLQQVITEDNFGADRIDYLIRDGHYTGVGYGHFDYHQLIDTLRILSQEGKPALGIAESGIQSVESLWIARYMMYARVYQHPKTRGYSQHMSRFMQRHYGSSITADLDFYLSQTDYTLLSALTEASKQGDPDANCLLKRIELKEAPFEGNHKIGQREFLVYTESGKTISSFEASSFLKQIPHH